VVSLTFTHIPILIRVLTVSIGTTGEQSLGQLNHFLLIVVRHGVAVLRHGHLYGGQLAASAASHVLCIDAESSCQCYLHLVCYKPVCLACRATGLQAVHDTLEADMRDLKADKGAVDDELARLRVSWNIRQFVS
jgi:hypothetical protein